MALLCLLLLRALIYKANVDVRLNQSRMCIFKIKSGVFETGEDVDYLHSLILPLFSGIKETKYLTTVSQN